jgi:AraC-like DNA-binding protein
MSDMVQAQSLRGYLELVTDLGGNPARLLRNAGVDPTALDQLTAFISFDAMTDLLERTAADLDCPDFGLRLAERQDIGILGALAVAMRYSDTVGEAMRTASRFFDVYNAAISFTISSGENDGEARLVFKLLPGHYASWAQTAEHGIGLTWRIMTLLSERRCHLLGVWFPHPPVSTEASYRARFPAPSTFGAEQAALAFAERDLNQPISETIEGFHDLATRYLESQLPRGSATFTLQVRRVIEGLLGTGTCDRRGVASAFHMHPRTLQRRLHEEGTTFEEIKEEVRQDLSERYLSQLDISLTQISALLGYSEQSAFARSCRRWFSASPKEMRIRLSSGLTV